MRQAIRSATDNTSPAPLSLTRGVRELESLGILLPEVQCLTWVNFEADGENKVLVRNCTIAISVEPSEDIISLFTFYRETEVPQKVYQFFFLNKSVCILIELSKSFANCGPLLPNLLNQFVFDVSVDEQSASCLTLVTAFTSFLLFHMLFKTWVPPTVVAENEACQVVNFIA